MNYWELAGFENLYLEDSWVLNIEATPGALVLQCDLVLLESHPDYTGLLAGEQYCYRRARIRFQQVRTLLWRDQMYRPAKDASGERDYGSIDSFTRSGDTSEVGGDFGLIVVDSEAPEIEFIA